MMFDMKQAADYLGISVSTMRRLIENNMIRAKKITAKDKDEQKTKCKGKNGVWRIKKEWIDQYINQGTELEKIINDMEAEKNNEGS